MTGWQTLFRAPLSQGSGENVDWCTTEDERQREATGGRPVASILNLFWSLTSPCWWGFFFFATPDIRQEALRGGTVQFHTLPLIIPYNTQPTHMTVETPAPPSSSALWELSEVVSSWAHYGNSHKTNFFSLSATSKSPCLMEYETVRIWLGSCNYFASMSGKQTADKCVIPSTSPLFEKTWVEWASRISKVNNGRRAGVPSDTEHLHFRKAIHSSPAFGSVLSGTQQYGAKAQMSTHTGALYGRTAV